jgi:beta-galactosidase/beta-glucuronidase
VDYLTSVWVNGQPVGEHEGGYTPFEFDITDLLAAGDNVVTVRVDDPADLAEIPHGKQSSIPANPWDDVDFTTVSGIWQTVWLEARPAAHITQAHITRMCQMRGRPFAVSVEAPCSSQPGLQVNVQAPDGRTFRGLNRLRQTPQARRCP